MKTGYYWVRRYKNERPSIAYLSKHSGWSFMGYENSKMIRSVGHSYPFEVLKRVEDYNDNIQETEIQESSKHG